MSDSLLAISGNYRSTIDSRRDAVLNGLMTGTRDSATITKTQARSDVRRSGFGNRLAGTIQSRVYPKSGGSFSPTALVYSKAPHIIGTHADGGTITARAAQSLAVPLSNGPAAKLRLRRGETRIEAAERRFGKLIAIKRPGKSTILAAELKRTSSGRLTRVKALKPLKTCQGPRLNTYAPEIVPLFTLVKNAQHKKRLDTRQILDKGRRRHPSRLARHMADALAQSERATAVR